MKILHIAVHLGGGVGTVLRNWIKKDTKNEHNILLLNYNFYGEKCDNIYENMRGKYKEIYQWIEKSDIVIIHFWNHPFLFEFIINAQLPKCRLCFWSHISGFYPPYIHFQKLIDFSDKFILSSEISYKSDIKINEKVNVIWTTGGVEEYLKLEKKETDEFIVGYIGTLDYSKLNPKFLYLCEKIIKKIPNVKFIICGSGCDEEKIKNEVKSHGLSSNFNFLGYVNNIKDIIPSFNVFGYPLNEKHFGTCEQVLGETMACGIEPVVLNNPSESFIVYGFGRICKNLNEYIDNIVDLYKNPTTKGESYCLKERADTLYSIDKMINSWNKIFDELILKEKNERYWNTFKYGNVGYKIFIESLGKYGIIFENDNEEEIRDLFKSNTQWQSNSKGSLFQYLKAFPYDYKLQKWSKFIL